MPDTPDIVKASAYDMQANPEAVQGQANETFMLKAKPGQALGTGGETVGFAKYKFQPELADGFMSNDPAKYKTMYNVAGSSAYLFNDVNMSQPEQGNDRGLLTRSVASTAVDQYLGTNVVAEERFGVDPDGIPIGISIQADGAGITGKYGDGADRKNAFLDVDYKNPDIQRGLSDLEVNDYLTGQIDRHGGNIFIDTSGEKPKVTGIDNDLAFPEVPRDKMQVNDKWVKDPPRFIHADTAQKILEINPDEYAAMLKNLPVPEGVSPLSDAAIEQAKDRLVKLQNAIRDENGPPEIVQNFDDHTYNVCVQEQEARLKQHLDDSDKPGYGTDGTFKMDDLKPEDSGTMLGCPRTSYLGTAAIQAKAYEIGMKEQADQYTVRPGKTTKPAARDLDAAERNRLRADPNQIQNDKLRNSAILLKDRIASSELLIAEGRKNIAVLNEEIASLEGQIESHRNTGGIKGLFSSGERKKLENELAQKKSDLQALEKKLPALQQQLEQRENKLDAIVTEAAQLQKEAHTRETRNELPQDDLQQAAPKNSAWQQGGTPENKEAEKPSVRKVLMGGSRMSQEPAQQQEVKEEAKIDPSLPKKDNTKKMREIFERQGTDASVKQGVIKK